MPGFGCPKTGIIRPAKIIGINVKCLSVLVLTFILISTPEVSARGRMIDPAQRSTLWQIGFQSPRNDDDSGLNCGGPWVQHGINNGKCGVCGDRYDVLPRDNEPGGKFANGIIANTYSANESPIPVTIHIQSFQGGYFEFRICPNNNIRRSVTQDCLDRHQLRVWDVDNKEPGYRYYPKGPGKQYLRIELPRGMTCTQCVLQWKWHTAKDWGRCVDGTSALGCGPQEEYYNCADIAIEPSSDYNVELNKADLPLPSEGPTPTIDTSKPTLNFEVGFKPYGQNLRQELNSPISFLPLDVLRSGNVGPVIPKFDFYDPTAPTPSAEPTVASKETSTKILDSILPTLAVTLDKTKQGAVVLEYNGNTKTSSNNLEPTHSGQTIDKKPYISIKPTQAGKTTINDKTPTVVPTMTVDQTITAMSSDIPKAAINTVLVSEPTTDTRGKIPETPAVSVSTAGGAPGTLPLDTKAASVDVKDKASTTDASLSNADLAKIAEAIVKQMPDKTTTTTQKPKPQDAGGIVISNLDFGGLGAEEMNVKVGMGAVGSQTEKDIRALPTVQELGVLPVDTGKTGTDATAISQEAALQAAIASLKAEPSVAPTATAVEPTMESIIANMNSAPSLDPTVASVNTAPIMESIIADLNKASSMAPTAADVNARPTMESIIAEMNAALSMSPTASDMNAALSGVNVETKPSDMNADPSQASSVVDMNASPSMAEMNLAPSVAPTSEVPASIASLLSSMIKPQPLVRRRRQAGVPPPPGPRNFQGPPLGQPRNPPGPAPGPGPQETINFGTLIGDSFSTGNSRTQTSFMSPADLTSNPTTGMDMTGEALIEPGYVEAPTNIGSGAPLLPNAGPPDTVFDAMAVDNMLPGPASMHSSIERALQPPTDTSVPYENPTIPRPPKQSPSEIQALIARAPFITSATSDTGVVMDPSALVGASYIPELNEGRSNQAETSTAARHSSMVIRDEKTSVPSGKTQEYLSPTRGTSLVDNRATTRAELRSATGKLEYRPTAEEILSGQASISHPTMSIDNTNLEAVGPSPTDSASVVPSILSTILGGGAAEPSDSSLDPAVQKTRQELIRKLGEVMGVIGPAKTETNTPVTSQSGTNQPTSDLKLSSLLAFTGGDKSLNLFGKQESKASNPPAQPTNLQTVVSPPSPAVASAGASNNPPGVAIDFNKGLGQTNAIARSNVASTISSNDQSNLPKNEGALNTQLQLSNNAKTPPTGPETLSLSASDLLGTVAGGTGDPFVIPGMTLEDIMSVLNVGQSSEQSPSTGKMSVQNMPNTKTAQKSITTAGMSQESFGMESAMFDGTPSNNKQITAKAAKKTNEGTMLNEMGSNMGMLGDIGVSSSVKSNFGTSLESLRKSNVASLKKLMMGTNKVGPPKNVIRGLGGTKLSSEILGGYRAPVTTVLAEMATTGSVAKERIDKSKQSKGKSMQLKEKPVENVVTEKTKQVSNQASPSQDIGSTLTAQDIEALFKAQNMGGMGSQTSIDPATGNLDMGNQMMFGLLGMGPDLIDPAIFDAMFGPTNQQDPSSKTQSSQSQNPSAQNMDQQAEAKLDAIAKSLSGIDSGNVASTTIVTTPKPFEPTMATVPVPKSPVDKNTQDLVGSARSSTVQMIDQTSGPTSQQTDASMQIDMSQEGTISLTDLLSGAFGFTNPAAGNDPSINTQQAMQSTGYETQSQTGTANVGEISINAASTNAANQEQVAANDFTPLGEVGAGSQFEALLSQGAGQGELVWDSVKQTWVPASPIMQQTQEIVSDQPMQTQKLATVNTEMTDLPATSRSDTVGFDSTAASFDIFGMQTTSMIGLIQAGQQKQIPNFKNPESYTEQAAVKIQTVDPKPTQPTYAFETAAETTLPQKPTTIKPVATTPISYTTTIHPDIIGQRKVLEKLQRELQKQTRELQLKNEKLRLAEKQLEIKRKTQAQLRKEMEVQRELDKATKEVERIREENLRNKEMAKLAKLKRLREAKRREKEKQKQIELKRKQEAELAKKKQVEAIAKNNAMSTTIGKKATEMVQETTTQPVNYVQPGIDGQSSMGETPSFTPLGSVGGAGNSLIPDAATMAAWRAYLETQQQSNPGANVATGYEVSAANAANSKEQVGQQFINPALMTLPNQQMTQKPQIPSGNADSAQAWQFLTSQNMPNQIPMVQAVPVVPQIVPGQVGQVAQTLPAIPNTMTFPNIQMVPGAMPAGKPVQGGAGILGTWSGLLQQQQMQKMTPAPTTTTTTTTTQAPTTPKQKMPIRPDPKTRQFVRELFINNTGIGMDPKDILKGLPPELLMRAGVNPLIVRTGNQNLIAPAVERTLGISLKPLEISPSGRIVQRPRRRKPPTRGNPSERAIERRQFMLQQRAMSELMHALGMGPEPLEPGDPGYRGPGATPGRPGLGAGMGMGGGGTAGAAPFELTDAQQIAIERSLSRQQGMGRRGRGGTSGALDYGMLGGLGGLGGGMGGGMGGAMGGGMGGTGTGW